MTATSAQTGTVRHAAGSPAPPRRLRLAVLLAETGLVVILGLIAARLIWTLTTPDAFAPRVETEAPAATPGVTVRGAQDWSVLWRFDPFFRDGGPAAPDEISNAPETTLNLVLAGVRAESGGQGGVAYIVTPDSVQGAFREREEIIGGVTLTRVFHDRAIIDRNGEAESLMLDAGRRPFQAGKSAAPAPAAAGKTEVIEQAQAGDLLARMQFEPYRGEGGVAGFMIRSDNHSLLAEYGLRPGDVVLSIGGVSAASAVEGGDPGALWSAFNAGGATQLEILREGERITRSVRLANGG